MKTRIVPLCASLALLLAATTAGAQEGAPRVVEKKRVVVRINADPESGGYQYVYVDNDAGEPVVLDSFVAERGYLGVNLLELTPELRRHFGADDDAGVMISRVEPDSPAATAGLSAGDILIALDSEPVDSTQLAARLIARGQEGDRIELEILRDRERRTLAATLDHRSRKQLDLGGLIGGGLLRAEAFELHHGGDHRRPLGSGDGVPFVELDPESMGEALRMAREHLDSPEWRQSLERYGSHRHELEERIRLLEERLRELEEQLGELHE